ncbi:MAG: DUF2961 domain-containing protein, partial [Acidobacteria bacterium]|nr:DUF2961 domain-containing protein [Acidobacteriota bacterium]
DERPYRSLVMGLTDSGYYSNFSMPFARRARIRLVNESTAHPLTAECGIVYRRRQAMPPGTGYFHAKWRRQEVAGVELHERNITGEYNYSILDVTGQGRYLGTSLNVYNRHLMWWGEGDPMIFVDEDTWPPSLHGTGTEEYFNDAWGFHPGISPVSGVLLAGLSSPGRCFGPNAVFTFHLADSIPFRRRIRVTLEHGPENSLTNDYASTAYWYALPGARDFFAMRPVAERLAALPSEWEKQRQERIREFAPELRRQIRDIASTLDQFPTDARRHPRRIRLLRLVFQLADSLSLPREPVRRLEALIAEARGRPLAERFPVMDRVLRELAGLL